MSTVREIVEAGAEHDLKRTDQLAALVALVQVDDGGRASAVPEHAAKARQYPRWPVADLARYGPRIALVTPQVMVAMTQLGIEGASEAVGDVGEAIAEPVLEVAREPLRWLAWLQDPGTVLRVLKVVGGGLLVVGGAWALARPAIAGQAGTVASVAGKVIPAGRLKG